MRKRGEGGSSTAASAGTTATYHGKKGKMSGTDVRDRTTEFKRVCASAQKRQNTPVRQTPQRSKTEFMTAAQGIGAEITKTTERLQSLSELAKRRSLFDDPAEEINELTDIIKQRIQKLSHEVNDLKATGAGGTSKQQKQHSSGVINSLQNTLKKTTAEFMGVVKTRQQNVEKQEQRKSQYGAASVRLESNLFSSQAANPLAPPAGGYSSGGPTIGGGGASFGQQGQLVMQQNAPQNYMQNRARDVEAVESTIKELGGIFSQLASIVAEQGEMVQRIDDNVEEVDQNVTGAQNELVKYLNSVTGNRMLIAKIFAVLMMFSAIWVIFFV